MRWFAELTTKWIPRGTHRPTKELTDSIQGWTDNPNSDPRPFVWHNSADDTFETMASHLQRIPDSGHQRSLRWLYASAATNERTWPPCPLTGTTSSHS